MAAVEGLEVAAPQLDALRRADLPRRSSSLLFAFQNRGTGNVGAVFGPVMLLWFVVLAVLGVCHIAQHPDVLRAISPFYAIDFFVQTRLTAFFALGAVVLCITGARSAVRRHGPLRQASRSAWSWFGFVLPALVLNYFGQGALLHRQSGRRGRESVLHAGAADRCCIPMIVLATAAAVIASQAVISGAFSVDARGDPARLSAAHGSARTPRTRRSGQIYLPWINRMLLVLTLAVVIGFRSSDNLGAAYGIAVVGTMTIDSILVMFVFRASWHWPWWQVVAVGGHVPVRRSGVPRRATPTRSSTAAGSRSCSAS